MAAAEREMRSPPMKYITTLNMVIWNVYIDCRCHFDEKTYIMWVGQDGESKHADDLHVDEIATIGEAGEGSKDRPGKEIIDRTPVTLT